MYGFEAAKKIPYKIYGYLHTVKHPKVLQASIKSILNEKVYKDEKHIKLAADWLLFMQNSDGGYARKFSFISGKDASYIETTGYIIPTILEVYKQLGEKKYENSALKAAEWLLKVQNSDGSFSEIDNATPFAFDTGQCLIGLNYLFEYTNDSKFYEAAKKAAYWLAENQENDGSWVNTAYNRQPHSYYARASASMLTFSTFKDDEFIKDAALKQIEWVLENQLPNGYFKYSSFIESKPPFLHTLIYILEGLLDVYDITKDETILEAVLKNSENFKNINLKRDIVLCSQYDSEFNCMDNKERCLTGLAQWAGAALRLYGITKDSEYKTCATNTLFYLKTKQIKNSIMKGGFSASIPFGGEYGSFDFVNWTNKFFIDSMLMYQHLHLSKFQEQESFVASSFVINSDVVTNELTVMDRNYIEAFQQEFKDCKDLRVLDIGCGEGVIIEELQKLFPNFEFMGVDPVFKSANIHKGSIYNIPFDSGSFDVIMSFEVLQHTYLDTALSEIYRVLKQEGKVVIGERNRISLLGVLKPIFELTNRWMYPYDSPFREKWYSKKSWGYHFGINGFRALKIKDIEGSGKKFVNRYMFIVGEKI